MEAGSSPSLQEQLSEYQVGSALRKEVKEQAALLFEKVTLLRLIDPTFDKELAAMGARDFLDSYTRELREARIEESNELRELLADEE